MCVVDKPRKTKVVVCCKEAQWGEIVFEKNSYSLHYQRFHEINNSWKTYLPENENVPLEMTSLHYVYSAVVTIHPGVVFYCNVCYLVEKCRCWKEDSAGALVWFSATLLCILDSWGQYPKSIDTMPNEDEELPGYHAAADRPSCSNAWYTVESVDKLMKLHETLSTL